MEPLFRVDGVGSSALLLGLVGGYPIGPRTTAELYRPGCAAQGRGGAAADVFQQLQPGIPHQRPGSGRVRQRPGGHLAVADPPALRAADGTVLSAVSDRSCWAPKCDKVLPFPHSLLLFRAGGIRPVRLFRHVIGVRLRAVLLCAGRPLSTLSFPLGPALVGSTELFSLTPLLTADRFGFVLSAAASGWGGLSVLCQTAAVLEGSGLSPGLRAGEGRTGTFLSGAGAAALVLCSLLTTNPPCCRQNATTEGIFQCLQYNLESG